MRNTSIISVSLILIAAILLAAPISTTQSWRNDLGDQFLKINANYIARILYKSTAAQRELRGQNNLLVLDYLKSQQDTYLTNEQLREIRIETKNKFETLAEQGSAAAAYNRAMFCLKCTKRHSDYKNADYYFRTAILLNDPIAQDAYNRFLFFRWTRLRDPGNRKFKQLRKMADDGDTWAASEVASYANGRKVLSTDELEHYQRIAAEAGYINAQTWLAYRSGADDAEYWEHRAADQEDIAVLGNLGEDFLRAGPERDLEKAEYWLTKAVSIAERGEGRKLDPVIYRSGLRWRSIKKRKSANVNNSASAAYDLAILLLFQPQIDIDMKKVEWSFRHAALDNWRDSRLSLLRMEQGKARAGRRAEIEQRIVAEALLTYEDDFKKNPGLRENLESGALTPFTTYDARKLYVEWLRRRGPISCDAAREPLGSSFQQNHDRPIDLVADSVVGCPRYYDEFPKDELGPLKEIIGKKSYVSVFLVNDGFDINLIKGNLNSILFITTKDRDLTVDGRRVNAVSLPF